MSLPGRTAVRPGVCTIQALTNPKEHRDAIVAFLL